MPVGTTYTWEKTPDVTQTGSQEGIVKVIYPNGSTENVPVTVNISSDASDNNPGYEIVQVFLIIGTLLVIHLLYKFQEMVLLKGLRWTVKVLL